MKANVILSSDLYGSEKFRYDTKREAKEGFNRLAKSIDEHFVNDNVGRSLTLETTKGEELNLTWGSC